MKRPPIPTRLKMLELANKYERWAADAVLEGDADRAAILLATAIGLRKARRIAHPHLCCKFHNAQFLKRKIRRT